MIIQKEANVYVALSGATNTFNKHDKKNIHRVIESLFGSLSKKVSEVEEAGFIEIVYQLQAPVISDYNMDEFFENLEIMFYELVEFNPHFTQFERGDV